MSEMSLLSTRLCSGDCTRECVCVCVCVCVATLQLLPFSVGSYSVNFSVAIFTAMAWSVLR